ncbi:MAG TPA: diguanylate cyclase [Geomonas sp.]
MALAGDRSSLKLAEQEILDSLTQSALEKAIAEAILSSVGAGLTVQDREFRIVYQNDIMTQLFGRHLGEKCHAVYEGCDAICLGCPVAGCFRDGETHSAERCISVNGASVVVENVAAPLFDETGDIVAAVELVRDITGRRGTEEKLARVSNLYEALSHTNKAIMKTGVRAALLQEVCQIAVDYGRFCLAWIGMPDPETGWLRPVAQSGKAQQYLERLKVSADGGRAEGQGPTGIAIRGKTPYICNDFLADPFTVPWHAAALASGIRASAIFPLGQAWGEGGALKVYSEHQGFFDAETIALLQEMAASISFALDNFSREEKRSRAEIALQKSEEQLKLVLEGSRDGFWDWDVQTGRFAVSDRYFEMLGYAPGEIEPTAAAIRRLVHPEDLPGLEQTLDEHMAGNTHAYEAEFRMTTRTGAWIWILERGKVVSRDAGGAPLRVAGTSSDITERKYFEENLRYVSTHDSMTGLFNRAYYDAELERVAQSRRYPVSIIIADVDGLKHVNDGFGHNEGDRLIRQAGQALREAFRAEDFVARIGGDEFAVILPDTDDDAVKEAVRRVRGYQAEINRGNSDYTLSLSIGSATAVRRGQLAETVRLADSRMYYYKFQRKAPKI